MQYMGERSVLCILTFVALSQAFSFKPCSGYLESCRSIVGAAKRIEAAVRSEIPELSIMGSPLASVVAFKSADAAVNIHAVGDAMSARGWHLNALTDPPGLHIACTVRSVSFSPKADPCDPRTPCFSFLLLFTSPSHAELPSCFKRLTVGVVEQLITELKECIADVKGKPLGKGNMVTLYGLCPRALIMKTADTYII